MNYPPEGPGGSTKEDIDIEQQLYEIVNGKNFACTQLFELKVYSDDNDYKRRHF